MTDFFEPSLSPGGNLSVVSKTETSPQFLVGLDLVFSGASGYSVIEYLSNRLIEQDLLDTGDRSSAKVFEKIERGRDLYNKLANLAIHYPKSIWIIEVTDWLNRAMPQRERETLKSLALARGLAIGAALIYQTAIPICLGVNEVRQLVIGHQATKPAQFDYIRARFQLKDLAKTEANMNVTDAIALPLAFSKVNQYPNISKQRKDIIERRYGKAVLAFQVHTSVVADQFGHRSALRAAPALAGDVTLKSLGLAGHLTPEYRKSAEAQGERWASIDISASHPGVVVYDRIESENPRIVFHHTFTLERALPDRKKAQSAYEIAVASNILRMAAILKAALNIQGIVFEYSDWHRGGRGKEFMKDRIAIDSLFFAYGALMAAAYHLKLPMVGVNATDAKQETTGKKNAGKAEIEAVIDPQYPFLKNEHTRDAAALMLTAHGPDAKPDVEKSRRKKNGEPKKGINQ
jgi:Holliday junction resolvasome RuvABC endonuclease subunit